MTRSPEALGQKFGITFALKSRNSLKKNRRTELKKGF